MDQAYLQELFQYSHWANGRARAAAAALAPEDFTRDLKNSFPSVRDTLVHIYDAEWTWLERWNGRAPGALPPGAPFATLAALETRWTALEREQADFVARLTDEVLDRPLHYINRKGEPRSFPLWRQMLHVVNHSTYHRGQITTMLRQLGAKPATTDLVVFYDQTGVRPSGRTS